MLCVQGNSFNLGLKLGEGWIGLWTSTMFPGWAAIHTKSPWAQAKCNIRNPSQPNLDFRTDESSCRATNWETTLWRLHPPEKWSAKKRPLWREKNGRNGGRHAIRPICPRRPPTLVTRTTPAPTDFTWNARPRASRNSTIKSWGEIKSNAEPEPGKSSVTISLSG